MMTERNVATIRADLADSVNEIVAHYPKSRSAIMPALYLAQEKYGSVDGVVYQAIAEILDIPEIYVFEVASFYTMFNRKKLGKFHIQLCTNVSCMLLGAYDVQGHLEGRLGIKAGGVKDGATTADGLFTLSTVECIGSCDVAPVMMINDVYHHNLTAAGLDAILDAIEEQESAKAGKEPVS